MTGSDAAARDVVLARVREALARPAPPPHTAHRAPHTAHRAEADAPDPLAILPAPTRPWLPDGGATPAERMDILLRNLALLRAVAHRAPDLTAATEFVFALARQRDWKRVAYHHHPLVEPLLAGVPCASHCVDDAAPAAAAKDALDGCDAGITACEALVAQTGSILVGSGTCGGRGLSVLPHVHVVIATVDQVVATLADAFDGARRRHGGRLPSMLSLITGPSRTGDIERILVLGAHGPRELIVVLVG
ncbi:MAG: lactate utilization protein C [Planctomycetaceae bacterium]